MKPDSVSRVRITGEAPSLVDRAWTALHLPGRIAVILVIVGLVLWLVVRVMRHLGRGGRRGVWYVVTGVSLVGLLGLGGWALRLPEPKGTYFVLWHQIVRVGAALSGTGFVVGSMALAVPWMLNRVEGSGYVSFVAARHVRAHRSGFLTVISLLSIAGVFLSSFALCAVVSIMGGFGADLKRKILGNNAHIRIESPAGNFANWKSVLDEVRLTKGVRAATPVSSGEAMASSSTNTAGVLLRGVDAVTIGTVIDLISNIEVGRFKYLEQPTLLEKLGPEEPIGLGPGGEVYLKGPDIKPFLKKVDPAVEDAIAPDQSYPGIIIGRELAKSLHVYVGDELTLISPLGELGPMGLLPKARRFRVAAIFYSGMYEYDASQAYVVLDVAQEFFDLGSLVSGIDVRVEDPEHVADVRLAVQSALGDSKLSVRDWKELNKNLFSALKLEKIATFIILSLAILVASFCIICTLLLMVTEKSKEIAILKALGATDRGILRIFMAEGMIIGGIGTVFGVATGLAVSLGLRWFGVRLDPDVYYVDRLPINVDPGDFALVAVAALIITTLATLYPALAASRLRPVDGIRYE